MRDLSEVLNLVLKIFKERVNLWAKTKNDRICSHFLGDVKIFKILVEMAGFEPASQKTSSSALHV